VRKATSTDVDAVVDTIATAFADDPVWGPAFPDAELRARQAATFWRLFVTSALRYPWLLVTDRVESAALWIPPGGQELTADEERGFEDFVVSVVGRAAADPILALSEQFDSARPSEPHFYLSLFGTHSAHRGAGLGMTLLRESLALIDELGMPAYLESSNPANNDRYRSVGFTGQSKIIGPGGQTLTTMWRPAR
jgi:GNAT superfamily N-acetyltransferase